MVKQLQTHVYVWFMCFILKWICCDDDDDEGVLFCRSAGRVSAQSVCMLVQFDAVLLRWSRSLSAHDGRRAGRSAVQHHQPAARLAHVVRDAPINTAVWLWRFCGLSVRDILWYFLKHLVSKNVVNILKHHPFIYAPHLLHSS